MIAAILELLKLATLARNAHKAEMSRDYQQAALELMKQSNLKLKDIYKEQSNG